MIYAGIGSRNSPPDILAEMTRIGKLMAEKGWLLRSGSSIGCDVFFEQGCDSANGLKEIYLPWKRFNNSTSLLIPSPEAFVLAATIHPAWNNLTQGGKKLHARNCCQVLGLDLESPAQLIICWTKDGKEVGGSATALKLARQHNIRIINLAIEKFDYDSIR
jgi:hypothetical protein